MLRLTNSVCMHMTAGHSSEVGEEAEKRERSLVCPSAYLGRSSADRAEPSTAEQNRSSSSITVRLQVEGTLDVSARRVDSEMS